MGTKSKNKYEIKTFMKNISLMPALSPNNYYLFILVNTIVSPYQYCQQRQLKSFTFIQVWFVHSCGNSKGLVLSNFYLNTIFCNSLKKRK